jgi:hypothetical protein
MPRTLRLGAFRLFLLAVLVVLFGQAAWAQTNRATITGTVTDSTGAVLANVAITATNTGTNVPTKTVSNHDGIYVIPNLFPGPYSVEFKKEGFETLLRPSITLNSTEVARIDTVLQVGATSTSITVTSDVPMLDMDTGSVGTNMKADAVNALPLSIYGGGRFVEDFAVSITPGYSVVSSPYGAVVNGGQWFVKDYTIDGTSGTSNIRGDSMDGGPSMEAVEELQAQTSGLDAKSAITGGGVMAFNLKSGTNKLHGSAFTYGVNEILSANTWTNDFYGTPKAKTRAWDYGFSLGGPIHKNKTFFFGTFERFDSADWRLNSGGATVPTTAMLGGDFSGILGATLCTDLKTGNTDTCADIAAIGDPSAPIMVYNDAGTQLQAQADMIYDPATGNQFTNNKITTISPLAQAINAYYANYPPSLSGVSNNERTLLAGTPNQTPNEFVVKLDHVLSDKDHLSGSWIYDHKPRLENDGGVWQSGTTNGGPLSLLRDQFYSQQQWRLSESHTFTSNLLNVLNFTDAYDTNASVPADPGDWNSKVGIGSNGAVNFPAISFADNIAGISETSIGNTWVGHVNGMTATTDDTVTWSKGRHNISFGGNFIAHDVNYNSGAGAYSFNFEYQNTSGPGYPYDGFAFATYELGMVNTAKVPVANNLYGRQKNIVLFAQDSYKLTSKLTVNLGVRWNYNTRFKEKYGNWANFDPTVTDQQLASVYGAAIPGSLVFAKNGGDSFEKNEYPNNYGPTLGIAYQLLPKTVLHASYGLIFNPVGITFFGGVPDSFAPQLGQFNEATNFNWDKPGGGLNFPGTVTKASLATDPSTMLPFPVETDPRALKLGYSEAFNFGVQQQLTPNTRLEVSYVGNRGHRLTDTALAWNETSSSNFSNLAANNPGAAYIWNWVTCSGLPSGVACPYPNFYGPALAAMAPLPQMAAAEVTYWYGCCANINYAGLPLGQSFYDSLVVDVVKRAGRGLTMDLSYDWSRQESDTFASEQDYNNGYTGVEDFQNMHGAAHALTGYDLPQVVKGFATYQLPFGKGQRWLATQTPVVNGIVRGWTLGGVVNYYTGQPFEIGASNPYWPLWGDIYPQFNLTNYKGPSGTGKYVQLPLNYTGAIPASNFYMPTSVANNPAAGYLPPSPNNSRLRCPGQANENSTLVKNDKVGPESKYNLSVRLDFYNLFNRHYYSIVGCGSSGENAEIGSSNFGQILGVGDSPRQGQFAIRLDF